MGRQTHENENDKLTAEQLVELRARFATMSRDDLMIKYKCCVTAFGHPEIRLPSPECVQQFVQAWRELRRRWKGRRRGR